MKQEEVKPPLGKMHLWWLRKFKNGRLGVDIESYAGTPYGKALSGLNKRGLVEIDSSFGPLASLKLTEKGLEEASKASK